MKIHGPLLVALDGSESAERVLGPAQALASALRTHLVLVSVLEDQSGIVPAMELELERLGRDHFASYLAGVRERLGRPETKTIVRIGNAADEIMACASEVEAGVIAIASHGRSGISRWMYGSTASALIQRSSLPLFVVGPHATWPPSRELRHVMVPLDGSPLAEAAVDAALQLTRAEAERLSLVRVVPWAFEAYAYTLPESYVPELDNELAEGAAVYLRRQMELIGGAAKTYVIRGGGTANALMDFIEQEQVDVVAMSTHGRSNVARAALGSTADRMVQATIPILLVPQRSTDGTQKDVTVVAATA